MHPLRTAVGATCCALLGACSPAPVVGPLDAGAAPDLSPVCLPAEPDPPTLPADCPVQKPATPDALDEALAREKLDRCSLTLPIGNYGGRDGYRLPWYAAVHDHPVNGPAWARTLTSRLDEAAGSTTPVARLLLLLGNRLGTAALPCVTPPSVDAQHPLAAALAALTTSTGGTPDPAALQAAVAGVPPDLQAALVPVVAAVAAAAADWATLSADFSADDLTVLLGTTGIVLVGAGGGAPTLTDAAVKDLLANRLDVAGLVAAAARLAAAIEGARLARFAGAALTSPVDVMTPIGRVVLRGTGDDTYDDDGGDAIALLVDTGGNDTYRKPVGAVGGSQTVGGAPIHVAVALDLAGDDSYGYLEQPTAADTARDKAMPGVQRLPSDADGRYTRHGPQDEGPISLSDAVRQGGARLGFGFLFDLAGKDHYRSLRMSQGFGAAGVGVLFDGGGDDLYESEAGAQGAGIFGVGLLFDAGGDDVYRTYANAQGFGYTRGAGLLYDRAGNDQYLADTGIPALGGDPIYYSPQAPCDAPGAPCGNSSFVQGIGFGRRAPGGTDTANMSGGLGVLRDVAGSDRYQCGIFGQASGYWLGTGVLHDGDGDDVYDGWWYTQGSAAHGALCVFLDDAGADRYDVSFPMNPPYSTNTGQGHDFSVGWHIDGGGDDVYRAPNLSLGSGNANGGGFLVNVGGNDQYTASSPFTLGGAAFDMSAGRAAATPCYGLFLDLIGTDRYMVPADPALQPAPADNTAWVNPRDPAPFNDLTVGVDRAAGQVSFP